MKKSLDISIALKSFEGEPIKEGGKDLTLRGVLLTYVSQAHAMGLTPVEEGNAFDLGMRLGACKESSVVFEQHQYDLLKKIVDNGKVQMAQDHKQVPLFSVVISQQAKRLVDAAVTLDGQAEL